MKRTVGLVSALALGLLAAGCGAGSETAAASKAPSKPRSPAAAAPAELYLSADEPTLDSENELRIVGMDDGPVPRFRVRAVDGKLLSSDELIGDKKPFVVLFFATWCPMCAQKMPLMRRALEAAGPVTLIAVSVDDPDTFPQVSRFLRESGLSAPVVKGAEHPRFSLAYNPFSLVPLVVVVGQNGGLVDYQMGYEPTDRERLIAAVKLARVIPPLQRHPRHEHPEEERAPD